MQRSKNETRRTSRGATSDPPTETPLAHHQRRIAELEATLADTEDRLKKARRESATADEMIGQMLARVSEVEGKLRATQKHTTEAEERAAADETDRERRRAELEAARTEATIAVAAAETAQEALIAEREQIGALRAELSRERAQSARDREERESLRAQLAREREERESLRARVAEFAAVCEERDQALRREEELEEALARAQQSEGAAEVQRLRGVLADVKRMLVNLEQRDADAARLRAGVLAAARGLLDKHAAEPARNDAVEPPFDVESSHYRPVTEPRAAAEDDEETMFFLKQAPR